MNYIKTLLNTWILLGACTISIFAGDDNPPGNGPNQTSQDLNSQWKDLFTLALQLNNLDAARIILEQQAQQTALATTGTRNSLDGRENPPRKRQRTQAPTDSNPPAEIEDRKDIIVIDLDSPEDDEPSSASEIQESQPSPNPHFMDNADFMDMISPPFEPQQGETPEEELFLNTETPELREEELVSLNDLESTNIFNPDLPTELSLSEGDDTPVEEFHFPEVPITEESQIEQTDLTHEQQQELLNQFHQAVLKGTADETQIQINELKKFGLSIDIPNKNSPDKRTALHSAAVMGRKHIVEILLRNHAKTNILDDEGRTPLQLAQETLDRAKRRKKRKAYIKSIQESIDMLKSPAQFAAQGPKAIQEKFEIKALLEARKAVRLSNIETVQKEVSKLKDLGLSIDEPGKYSPDKKTLLHLAVSIRRNNIVEILLRNGASIHSEDKNGLTPLSLAEKLLEESIEGTRKADELNAIIETLENADQLAAQGPLTLGEEAELTKEELNALISFHQDIRNGNEKDVENDIKKLNELGININTPNTKSPARRTALHAAVAVKRNNMVVLLLQFGANALIKDKDGLTPLKFAEKLLSKKRNKDSKIAEIIETLQTPQITLTIDQWEALGNLHTAIRRHGIEHIKTCIKKVIELGVDINTPYRSSKLKRNPLHQAVSGKRTNVVDFLLKNGASTLVKDVDGITPLDLAIDLKKETQNSNKKNKEKLIKLFDIMIKMLENPESHMTQNNATEDEKNKALGKFHTQATGGAESFQQSVNKMKDLGISLNTPNRKSPFKRTALHAAAAAGKFKIVKILLENGVNTEILDSEGFTALSLAKKKLEHMKTIPKSKNTPRSISNLKQVIELLEEATNTSNTSASIDQAPDITQPSFEFHTPTNRQLTVQEEPDLHQAVRRGNLRRAQAIASQINSDIDATDANGHTALRLAIANKDKKMVQMLLEQGAELTDDDQIPFQELQESQEDAMFMEEPVDPYDSETDEDEGPTNQKTPVELLIDFNSKILEQIKKIRALTPSTELKIKKEIYNQSQGFDQAIGFYINHIHDHTALTDQIIANTRKNLEDLKQLIIELEHNINTTAQEPQIGTLRFPCQNTQHEESFYDDDDDGSLFILESFSENDSSQSTGDDDDDTDDSNNSAQSLLLDGSKAVSFAGAAILTLVNHQAHKK